VVRVASDSTKKVAPQWWRQGCSTGVRDAQRIYAVGSLDEIFRKVNGLSDGELTDDDQLVYRPWCSD
jgi:hypothetical protein